MRLCGRDGRGVGIEKEMDGTSLVTGHLLAISDKKYLIIFNGAHCGTELILYSVTSEFLYKDLGSVGFIDSLPV